MRVIATSAIVGLVLGMISAQAQDSPPSVGEQSAATKKHTAARKPAAKTAEKPA
ncbi:MAG: hypothetical protein JO205_01585, partial [Pseudolabrys sp.]|nr:hypothetical protein [Pseudolabrys sp.]